VRRIITDLDSPIVGVIVLPLAAVVRHGGLGAWEDRMKIEEAFDYEKRHRAAMGSPHDTLRIVRADMPRIRTESAAAYEKWRASVEDSLRSAPASESAYRCALEKALREAAAGRAAGGPHYVLDYVYSGDVPITWVGRYAY
jgi:hypothetical protein